MNRFFVFSLIPLFLFAACAHKTTPDEALQQYVTLQEENNAFLESLEAKAENITSQDEYNILAEQADSAYNHMIVTAFNIAKPFSGEEVCTRVLSELHYYLTTEQKDTLFAGYTHDQIAGNEALTKIHKSYLSEKKTSVGKTYTDFSAPQTDGTPLAISELVGKTDYLLIDFWASWCGPCRASMPAMKELYARTPKNTFEIIGVSLDNNSTKWTDAIQSLGLPWRHISDLKGWECEGAALYGVPAIPATVLIDRNGTIVGRNLSHEEIARILAQ